MISAGDMTQDGVQKRKDKSVASLGIVFNVGLDAYRNGHRGSRVRF
jgi:hypothetical protein